MKRALVATLIVATVVLLVSIAFQTWRWRYGPASYDRRGECIEGPAGNAAVGECG